MISRLIGVPRREADGSLTVMVGGVGYHVHCSGRTAEAAASGCDAEFLIDTHVRPEAIMLYGFATASEQSAFRLLTSIQGVGPRTALAVLSAMSPGSLAQAVAAGNKGAFSQAPGVGPKTAARIVAELAEKVSDIPADVEAPGSAAAEVAVSALVNLGYRRKEAAEHVARAALGLGLDVRSEQIVKAALISLQRESIP